MKHSYCMALLSILTITGYGQYNYYQTEYTFQSRANGMMTQLAPAPKEKVNSVYLYNEFINADIYYKDSTKTVDVYVKLDIMQNVIDIDYNNEVKMLPLSKVLGLLLKKPNGLHEFYINNSFLPGYSKNMNEQLCQVLTKDAVSLYSLSKATIVEPVTNPALGLKIDSKIEIKKKYLIIYKDNMINVASKSELKKEVARIFGAESELYLKKINIKREADLKLLVENLNGLVK